MINTVCAQLGVNLALIAHDHKLDLTPKTGSLLDELSRATNNAMGVLPISSERTIKGLVGDIHSACSGVSVHEDGRNQYACSSHDALMDNTIVDLAQLMGGYVSYARSVVNPKVNHLVEAVRAALQSTQIKEAEDFFEVSFYTLPQIFESDWVEDEVFKREHGTTSPEVINFGEALQGDFDLNSYFVTGEDTIDQQIGQWASSVGKDTLMSYLCPKSSQFELTLFGEAAINYHFCNFLFYRQLHLKQDIALPMSKVSMISTTAANRDYHARQLNHHLNQYHAGIKGGQLLSVDTHVTFSYLSGQRYPITIYENSFNQLSDVPEAMEKIFGAIANGQSRDLTVQTLKAQADEFQRGWKVVRGLYTSYLTSGRTSLLKSALKLSLHESIHLEVEEDRNSPLFDEAYTKESTDMAMAYIDTLQASDTQDLYKVCLEVMGRYIYRFSNAYFFLREMYEILEADGDLEPSDAAHAACVRYLTDFLLEQVDVSKTQTL